MDQININTVNDYESLRQALNKELNSVALHFCRIGYLLKRARDENHILKDSSYSNVNEFASSEFGLDASQVSRFIRINDRFSIGGYSEHLKSEYEEFGSAKLSLMLMLPDGINEELSPDMSKSEINTIKTEYEAEQKISDLEVMMEDTAGVPDEFIMAVVHELNDEHPDPAKYFAETMKLAGKMGIETGISDIKEAYIPEGTATYIIRIPGQGRFMVNMKDEGIMITSVRDSETKSPLSWPEFETVLMEDMKGREFEEKKEEKKPEKKRKTEKVKPAKPKKPEIAPVQEETVEQSTDNVPQEEPEVPFPEVNAHHDTEEYQSKELENSDPAAGPEVVEDEEGSPEQKLLEEINIAIRNMEEQIRARNWSRALIYLEDIEFRIKRMKEV